MAKEGDSLAKKLSKGQQDYDASGDLATAKQKSQRQTPSVGTSYDKASSKGQLDKSLAGPMPTGVHKGAQSSPQPQAFDRSSEFKANAQSKGHKK